jgi:hypothetical protein
LYSTVVSGISRRPIPLPAPITKGIAAP